MQVVGLGRDFIVALGDVPTMTIKTSAKDKFANNYWVQMAVMVIVLAVIIEIATRHIW